MSMKKTHVIKVPLLGDLVMSVSRTIMGIALGLLASAVLIAISGVNPFVAYWAMLKGAFGSLYSFSNVLVRVSPLLLGGMGVALGIKAGVWNTGIEGYMYLGAIGAAIVAIPGWNLPPVVHILLVFIAGMAFAAVWGLVPGYLRAYRGVNEVTSTIMLNYVAIYLTTWLVSDFLPIADSEAFYPMSKQFQESAQLPILMRGTSLHPGAFIGLGICLLFYFILSHTSFGFRTRMLGCNPNAARYAGVKSKKQVVIIMMIGAMLGGLAGAIEVSGLKHRVFMEFVTNVGYESVAVALLAGGSPIGVIVSAFFFAVLKVGGAAMSVETGVGSSMTDIIIALCVLFVVAFGISDGRRMKKKAQNVEKAETVTAPEKKEEE